MAKARRQGHSVFPVANALVSAQQGPLLNPAQHTLPRLCGSSGDLVRKGEAGCSRDQDSSLKGAEAAEGSCHGPRDALPASAQGPRAFLPLQIRRWFSRPRITVRTLPSARGGLFLHRQPLSWPQPGPDKGSLSRDRVSEPSQPLGLLCRWAFCSRRLGVVARVGRAVRSIMSARQESGRQKAAFLCTQH